MGDTSNKQPANQLARGSIIGSIALAAGYLVQYLFQRQIAGDCQGGLMQRR